MVLVILVELWDALKVFWALGDEGTLVKSCLPVLKAMLGAEA
jgi:hypothetical protein